MAESTVMHRTIRATILAVTAFAVAAPGAEKAPAGAPADAVAIVGGEPITAQRLEQEIRGQLLDLRMREYQLRSRALDEIIARTLVEKEAKARGVSQGDLSKAEVDDKVAVSEPEARAHYEANKARFKDQPEEEALKRSSNELRQQRVRERRLAFVRELREKAGVRVLLEPVRVTVEPGNNPSRGPAAAPVTIVEFSDFQCPYCARALPTLKKVQETYGDRVRMVFRDFPLQNHPQAPKAAEAAGCADEQGRFWEMHDRLFANQAKLQVPDLKQHAAELGLESAKFDECLDSGRRATDWQLDLAEGSGYGVTGTPAFFINGRMLVGAQPYESFVQVIEDELARAADTAKAAKDEKKDPKKKPGPS
jgi:protein-disulfide isomerase